MKLLKYIYAILILLLLAGPSCGQDVGFGIVQAWSNHADLENPFGYTLSVSQSVQHDFDIRLEFSFLSNQRDYLESSPDNTGIIEDETNETINSRAQITAVGFSLLYNPVDWDRFDVIIGGGFSLNILNAQKVGIITGKTLPVHETTKLAFNLHSGLRWRRILQSSFGVYLNYCVGYLSQSRFMEDEVNPFNGDVNLTQLELGLLYSF